ncbi:MAG: hypothetical protein KGI06_02975 [Candidatus Micrarchaeota archaeon]|nr:hypothetical protein [Candidatus Micrarchaeota archaeon]
MRHKSLVRNLSNMDMGGSDRMVTEAMLRDMEETRNAIKGILCDVKQTSSDISKLDDVKGIRALRGDIAQSVSSIRKKRLENRHTKRELLDFLRSGSFAIESKDTASHRNAARAR